MCAMSKHQDIYGIHAVAVLLNLQPDCVAQLFVQKSRQDKRIQALLDTANQVGISVQLMGRDALDKRAASRMHQGVIADCVRLPSYQEADIEIILQQANEPALLLILDGIQDPHNLGACLRTANAMGVHVVIAPKDRAAGITPVVTKVSCGASLLTPFIQVTNLARTLKNLQQQGIWIVGADADSEQMIHEVDCTIPTALVMGAEGKGLRELSKKHCDFLAKIPMTGAVESLNVSVATGMCLYEINRQRNR